MQKENVIKSRWRIRDYSDRIGHEIVGKLTRLELPAINGQPTPAMYVDDAGTGYFLINDGADVRIVEHFVPAA